MEAQPTTQDIEDSVADMIFGEEPEENEPEEVQEAPEKEVEAEVEDDSEPEDDDSEDSEEEEPEAESDLVEVEFEGQLLEAPKAVAEALMRQSDYTKKTQEVAEQRKAIEVQLGELEQRHKQYQFAQDVQPDLLKVQQLEEQTKQAHQYLRDNIDSLSSTDIEKIRLAIEDARGERDQLVQSIQGKTQEFQQAQEQSKKELLKKGTEVLRSKIPNWGESHIKQVAEFAIANGFTEQEVGSVVDPRQVEVLWKASQYDALQKGKTAAIKKVQDAPTIKPKARNPMPEGVKRELNLRKKLKSPNLSDKDKAKLIEADLGERWS